MVVVRLFLLAFLLPPDAGSPGASLQAFYQLLASVQHFILISLKIPASDGIAGVPNYLHKLVICPENEE